MKNQPFSKTKINKSGTALHFCTSLRVGLNRGRPVFHACPWFADLQYVVGVEVCEEKLTSISCC